eukprot:7595023-Pyramimonas_sp.AAC.1
MNDFGRTGDGDPTFVKKGRWYRKISAWTVGRMGLHFPVIDTRPITRENNSPDFYHHPNLQQAIALTTLHTLVYNC